MDKILKTLLVLLGFGSAGCNSFSSFGQIDEYGAPMTNFTVKGRVVDADKKPVTGIRVSAKSEYGDESSSPAMSGADGTFEVKDHDYSFMTKCQLLFEDIDGEENGGEFADKEITVTFTEEDRVGKPSTWITDLEKSIGDVGLELKNKE